MNRIFAAVCLFALMPATRVEGNSKEESREGRAGPIINTKGEGVKADGRRQNC